jgi:hypothetical protein
MCGLKGSHWAEWGQLGSRSPKEALTMVKKKGGGQRGGRNVRGGPRILLSGPLSGSMEAQTAQTRRQSCGKDSAC